MDFARIVLKAQLHWRALLGTGYVVSTVGLNEEQIKRYIRDQEGSDGSGRF